MEAQTAQVATPRTLIWVWLALVALAAVSLASAWADLGPYGPAVALAAATAKAALMVYFFMGLRYEGMAFRLLFFLSVVLVALILGLTFVDIEYR